MNKDLFLDGEKFISAKRGAQITGYTEDYIGQLARSGRMTSKKLGRTWYVSRKSLLDHRKLGGAVVEQKGAAKAQPSKDIFFNGERYISTKEAAQAAGYSEDYVGQLARGGALQSKMVGRAWYVSRRSILAHKKINSAKPALPPKKPLAQAEKPKRIVEAQKPLEKKISEVPALGATRPLSLPPITGYVSEKVSVLPALSKKLPIKIWGLRKSVVKEAIVAGVSILMITGSAFSWVDHFSPALADRTLNRLEEVSAKEQELMASALKAVNPYPHLMALSFLSDVRGGFGIVMDYFRDKVFYARETTVEPPAEESEPTPEPAPEPEPELTAEGGTPPEAVAEPETQPAPESPPSTP